MRQNKTLWVIFQRFADARLFCLRDHQLGKIIDFERLLFERIEHGRLASLGIQISWFCLTAIIFPSGGQLQLIFSASSRPQRIRHSGCG
jgi:hypothetical protein